MRDNYGLRRMLIASRLKEFKLYNTNVREEITEYRNTEPKMISDGWCFILPNTADKYRMSGEPPRLR